MQVHKSINERFVIVFGRFLLSLHPMKKEIAFLCIMILCCMQVKGKKYEVRHLGLDYGLSNTYIFDTTIDKYGYLWVATEDGLNRFDGNRFFTYYKFKGNNKLNSNELSCVVDDPNKSQVWIGNLRDGLNIYDYKNSIFKSYRHDSKDVHSLASNNVTNVRFTGGKNPWISFFGRGIDYFDQDNNRFIHYNKKNVKGLGGDFILCFEKLNKNMMLVGHAKNGMSLMNISKLTATNFQHNEIQPNAISGNWVYSICKDKEGHIWVATDHGLDLFDINKKVFRHINRKELQSHRIFAIREAKDGKLWLGLEQGGIAILNISRKPINNDYEINYIKDDDISNGLSGATVRTIDFDKFNNVWIGVYGAGIDFLTYNLPPFHQLSFSEYEYKEHLKDKTIHALSHDNMGNIWMGTDEHGIEVFSKDMKRLKDFPTEAGKTIQCILRTSDDNIWIGSFWNGTTIYNPKSNSFKQIFPKPAEINVKCIHENRNKKEVLIGTDNSIYKVDMKTFKILKRYNLKYNQIQTIYEAPNGNYWIGTFDGGLLITDRNFKKIKRFSKSNGFPNNNITDILMDKFGAMWIATQEGLVKFKSTNSHDFKIFDTESGLGNNHIQAMAQDKDGNIWMSTDKGITAYYARDHKFHNYGQKENIPLNNFATGAVDYTQDGKILYGTIGAGLIYFNPKNITYKLRSPQARVSSVIIYDNNNEDKYYMINIAGLECIEVWPEHNIFTINFNVENQALANRVEYSYKIDGLSNEWSSTHGSSITLRDMTPGNYNLYVRARLSNQEWNHNIYSIELYIEPHLWQTWWARLLYLTVSIGIIYAVYMIYNRHIRLEYMYNSEKQHSSLQKEINAERMRFFTNITHELRTPLTLIAGPLEDIAGSKSLPDKTRKKMVIINQNVQRLRSLVEQILEYRKVRTDRRKLYITHGDIVDTIYKEYIKFEQANKNDNLSFAFRTTERNICMYYDKEAIIIIIDNLLTNATKYTPSGYIGIKIEQLQENGSNKVKICVSDTGYGISPEALPHIFERYYQENNKHQASGTGIGLALVKDLAEMHKGEIEALSKVGIGSKFILTLNYEYTYPDAIHDDVPQQPKTETGEEKDINVTESDGNGNRNKDQDKYTLLIVDDNNDICNYIADYFKQKFNIITASNGKQGLAAIKTTKPNIIICDVMMPEMDGYEMCTRLKNNLDTRDIPIILLTAKDSEKSAEKGFDSGADAYITKPFTNSLLRSLINNLLKQRNRMQNIDRETVSIETAQKHGLLVKSMDKTDQDFFDKLNKKIEENISGDIDILYLSEAMGVSSSTLYRKLKKTSGISANEYVRRLKMQYAEHLLLQGKYSISQIAYMVGMNSVPYFRKCFKDEYGEIPSTYIKRIKDNLDNNA